MTTRESTMAPVDRAALAATLAEILSRTTGLRAADLDPEASFLELGLSSIALVDTFRAVREALGVRPSIRRVFEEHRTLEKLTGYIAELLEAGEGRASVEREALVMDGTTELSIPPSLQHVWFLARYSEEASRAHQSAAGMRIAGGLDPARLERAWAAVVARHGALRVRAIPDRDALFVEPVGAALPIVRVRATGEQLGPAIAAAASGAIDLARASVRLTAIDAAEQGTLVILAAHALVADRPSLELLLAELCTLLADLGAELPPALPFAEVLARLGERTAEASLAYFREQLVGRPAALDLPTDKPRPPVKAYGGARLVRPIPRAIADGVAAAARQVGVPTSVVVLGALAHLLRRLTGTRPVVIGVHGRLDEIVPLDAAAVAPLSSPLPVLIPLPPQASVRELLLGTRSALAGALDHTGVPFAALVDALEPGRDQSRSALFVVSFDAQGERPLPEVPGLVLERIQLPTATCRTDLALTWIDGASGVELALDYSTELFERSTAIAWAKALIATLEVLPRSLAGSSSALSVASGPPPPLDAPPPKPERVELAVPMFLAAARAHPARPAVLGSTGALTYAELEAGSAALAARLVERGVGPEDRVGISLTRGPLLVQAVLGVLRAGAAYVPLDPAYPVARLHTLAADAKLAALIADHPATWADPGLARVAPTEAGADRTALDVPQPSHAAYVLYTSGSTGMPKGVIVEQGSLARLLAWAHGCFSREELAYTFASTSLSFDLSAFELLAPLTAGGTVVIARDALELVDHPERERVTLLNTVPSAAAQLVRLRALPGALEVVALAGEALRGALVRAVREQLGPGARIFNLYGPTECTVYATAAELRADDPREPTIGRPIAGLTARVVDDEGAPCPPGGRGELWLSGPTVARGYLGRPELTAERFVEGPTRAYRTGDLVRARVDGELEFLGRLDHQVKLRGFRIELGEVEAALTGPGGASEARVESEGEGVDQRLVAYVAGVGPRTATDLRAALAEVLPDPLVPRHIVVMDALPRLPNGKLDRARLPRGAQAVAPAATSGELRTPTERALGEVWTSILGVPSVTATDDFFALGGHSLMMTALLVAIRERFGVRPKLRAMFDAPTLAGLARHVDALTLEASSARLPGQASSARLPGETPRMPDDPAQIALRFERLDRDSELPADLEVATAAVDPTQPARHVLLTGATGFVGVHVLAELLRRSDARVSCVVRGADPMARIRAALDTFQLADGLDLSRVETLSGDVARPELGLSRADYTRLSADCDRVLHGAAEVNFVYPYDALRRTNVGGTLEVLRFAARTRRKPLFFLSTSAVWPMGAELSFDEGDDLHHGHRLNLGYDESKWVGERMVERARALGLPAFVLRPGEVSGHSVTGRGVGEHFAMALVKGSLEIGAVPPFHGMVDLSPVDYVAAGTAELVLRELPRDTHFHLTNPWPMDAADMLEIMREVGYRFEQPEFDEWKRRLFDHPRFAQNALYPYAPILEDFDPRNLQFPHYGSSAARGALEPRGVKCHPLDRALVQTYLAYYQATGFLPRP